MAAYDGLLRANPPAPSFGGKSAPPRAGIALDPGAVTTYCYRTSGGTRGTATDLDAIPAGAEIERTVTQ